jgi:hypothetical protein
MSDTRMKEILLRRMRDAVANPPQRVIARDLLARGLTANEIHQLVVRDPSFDSVPYAFRVGVANAARELGNDPILKRDLRPAVRRRYGHA